MFAALEAGIMALRISDPLRCTVTLAVDNVLSFGSSLAISLCKAMIHYTRSGLERNRASNSGIAFCMRTLQPLMCSSCRLIA